MTIHGVEYDVLFDGSHEGHDYDLLCCDPVPVKLAAPPIPRSHWSITHGREDGATRAAILACCTKSPCTRHDLKVATGFSEYAIGAAIRKLQHDEQIHVVGSTRSRARGRWLRQYAGTA